MFRIHSTFKMMIPQRISIAILYAILTSLFCLHVSGAAATGNSVPMLRRSNSSQIRDRALHEEKSSAEGLASPFATKNQVLFDFVHAMKQRVSLIVPLTKLPMKFKGFGSRPCVNVPTRKNGGGFGNVFFKIMYGVYANLKQSTDGQGKPQFNVPCLNGPHHEWAGVFGRLFLNLQECPDKFDEQFCASNNFDAGFLESFGNDASAQWLHIQKYVAQRSLDVPDVLKFNTTFVEEIINAALLQKGDLETSCAIHIRFGDRYFRQPDLTRNETLEQRLCQWGDASAFTAEEEQRCFEEVADLCRGICADPSLPIYVATDHAKFITYFEQVEKQSRKVFTGDSGVRAHIEEGSSKLGLIMDPSFHILLQDWFAFALSKHSGALQFSTFSVSALLVGLVNLQPTTALLRYYF